MIITIDGYSCQGKSTVARALAKELGWEFFSIGTAFRFLATVFHRLYAEAEEDVSREQAVRRAVEQMHGASIAEMQSNASVKTQDTERALQILAEYPFVQEEIAGRISVLYRDKRAVLDGRIGFRIFPHAYRNYYFKTSMEKRALFASRSRNLSKDAAMEYVAFRDSFEYKYDIPSYVRVVTLDAFSTTQEIVSYLKKDISKGANE